MATLRLEIITAERQVFADDVNVVVAPGIEGELGILPHHAPLMTMLKPGELLIRKNGEEMYLAVSGGFLEVRPDKVIILADACERAEEIDITRAEEAKRRAEERIKTHPQGSDVAQAQAALLRSLIRIRIAERRRRKSTQR
ncbi:MAG: F0F1 ATP synthase subunit epsilon [Dehalococcoidia bacterium]|nr:F0F1 ATP synthase subunit epsilon [Dehalococcoidia bacterium]